MAIVAVGSLAFDSIQTAEGRRERVIGGSLTHFSNAAHFLSKPKLVGVVGEDFGDEEWEFIRSHSSSQEGIVVLKGQKSFFWQGHYTEDMDNAITDVTELNAFAHFDPMVPASYREGDYLLFLANIDPVIQTKVAHQCSGCALRILDTMNYWINNTPRELEQAMDSVEGIVVNEGEAVALTGEKNLIKAGEKLFRPHYRLVILKKGSHGVLIFGKDYIVSLPAYPLTQVVDTTGAGDSFAGAFFSYIDARRFFSLTREEVKQAAVYATVVASYSVQGFGVEGIGAIGSPDIQRRLEEYRSIAGFDSVKI